MLKKAYTILLALCLSVSAFGQTDSLSVAERNALQGFNDTIDRLADDFVRVSLVVCDPEDVLYSALGHAALHLQCPVFHLDYIFSYESESVRDKIWTFLRGDLKMGLFAIPTDEFLESYRKSGRGVKEYTINLSPEQKQKLWEVMDNMVTEGTSIPYDYFRRGCAKSVVYVMHRAIGQTAIHYAPWNKKYTEHTLRELATSFATNVPWIEFISYFLVGIEGDKTYPCEKKLIVPTDLVEVWQQATFDSGKMVLDRTPSVLLETKRSNESTWCTPLLISIVLLILSIWSMSTVWMKNSMCLKAGNIIDYAIGAIVTLAGVLTTYLVCFSSLPCTSWNWLIIPFNILPAIGWYWRRYWSLPYAIIVLIWCLVMAGQFVWGHILVDWAHIIIALSFAVVLFKQWYSARSLSESGTNAGNYGK